MYNSNLLIVLSSAVSRLDPSNIRTKHCFISGNCAAMKKTNGGPLSPFCKQKTRLRLFIAPPASCSFAILGYILGSVDGKGNMKKEKLSLLSTNLYFLGESRVKTSYCMIMITKSSMIIRMIVFMMRTYTSSSS